MRLFLTIIGLTTAMLLTGCSREPTESELRQAYAESLAQTNQVAVKIAGDRMKIDLQDFKKLSCQQPGPSADAQGASQSSASQQKQYQCDIQVKLDLPLVGVSTQNGKMTVVKHDRGWVVLSNN